MSETRLEALKSLVDKNPNSALGRYGLANEYMKLAMWEDAIREIEAYLKLKDDEGAVYRMLADAYTKLGRGEKAREALRRGIEAAQRHGHPSMVEEYEEMLQSMD